MSNHGSDHAARTRSSGGSSDPPAEPVERLDARLKSGRTLMIAGAASFVASIILVIVIKAITGLVTGESEFPSGGIAQIAVQGALCLVSLLFFLGVGAFLIGCLRALRSKRTLRPPIPVSVPISPSGPPDPGTESPDQPPSLPDQPQALVALLDEGNDAATRRAAAASLKKLGEPAVPSLISVLRHGGTEARSAARILGRIGDPRAVKPLLDIALGFTEKSLRADANKALLAIGEPAFDPILRALKSPDSMTRRCAAGLLGQMGDARAVAPLAAALRSADAYSRGPFVTALGKIGGEKAAAALVAALQYKDVRPAATGWLVKFGPASVKPLVAIINRGKEPDATRQAATEILKKIDRAALEEIRDRLPAKPKSIEKGKDPNMKKQIKVPARGHYDSAPLLIDEIPDLEQLFADPPIIQESTERNREYWSSAKAEIRRMTLTTGYLQHPAPEVRLKTLELIAKHRPPGNDQLLFDLLAVDPDEAVRREAARITWLLDRDANCKYAVNKAKDEIAYGLESHPVGPTRAKKALVLLVEAAPDEDARKALEHQISLPWP